MGLWEELGWTQGRPGPLSFCRPSHRQTGMALVDIFSRIRGILMPLMILLGEHRVSLLVLIYGSLPSGAGLLGPADRDTWPDPEGHCQRPGARILTTVRCLLSLKPRTSHQWPLFQNARSLLYHLSIVAEGALTIPILWGGGGEE